MTINRFILFLFLVLASGSFAQQVSRESLAATLREGRPSVSWKSKILNNRPVTDKAKAARIVDSAMKDEKLRKEMHAFLSKYGGLSQLQQSPELWETYLSLLDAFTPFSEGYLQLIDFYNEQLPKTGNIADIGSGTGNIGVGLIIGSAQRRVHFLDIAEEGIRRTLLKLNRAKNILKVPLSFTLMPMDLRKFPDFDAPLAGVLINNVLHSIPSEEHAATFSWIARKLQPGGRFCLGEPNPAVVASTETLKEAAKTVILSAIENGTKATGYEIALSTYINLEVLRGHEELPNMRKPEDWVKLGEKTGFKMVRQNPNLYYKILNTIVFEK